VPLEVLPVARKSTRGADSTVAGLELPLSPSGLRQTASRQSGWIVSEFQTVTEAASEASFRRPLWAIHPIANESGTFPWVKSDLVASLL